MVNTECKYTKPCEMVSLYHMSRSTIYRLMQTMASVPKYKDTVLNLGHKNKLVKIEEWEQFLHEYSNGDYKQKNSLSIGVLNESKKYFFNYL